MESTSPGPVRSGVFCGSKPTQPVEQRRSGRIERHAPGGHFSPFCFRVLALSTDRERHGPTAIIDGCPGDAGHRLQARVRSYRDRWARGGHDGLDELRLGNGANAHRFK